VDMVKDMVNLRSNEPPPGAWKGVEALPRYAKKLSQWFRDKMQEGVRRLSNAWVLLDGFDVAQTHPAVFDLVEWSMQWIETRIPHVRLILLGYDREPPDGVRLLTRVCPIAPTSEQDIREFLSQIA